MPTPLKILPPATRLESFHTRHGIRSGAMIKTTTFVHVYEEFDISTCWRGTADIQSYARSKTMKWVCPNFDLSCWAETRAMLQPTVSAMVTPLLFGVTTQSLIIHSEDWIVISIRLMKPNFVWHRAFNREFAVRSYSLPRVNKIRYHSSLSILSITRHITPQIDESLWHVLHWWEKSRAEQEKLTPGYIISWRTKARLLLEMRHGYHFSNSKSASLDPHVQ